MNEESYKHKVFSVLQRDFLIYPEVEGVHCSGRRMRIDAVVVPREPAAWANPRVALGIEFKNEMRLRGDTKNYAEWFAQCVDYTYTRWGKFGYIFIFVYPSLTDTFNPRARDINAHWLLTHLMSKLGIGELRDDERYGLTFFLNRDHRVWSQLNGVEEGKRYSLRRKFGSR